MNDILIFAMIVIIILVPFGIGVVYTLYKKTIIFPVALMVFFSSMFTGIVSFAISDLGFNSLYWAIPACLAFLVSTNAVFKKMIQRPIKSLNENINLISKGIINTHVDEKILKHDNELGQLAESLKTTLVGLNNTSAFANNIANGKLNINYDLLSKDDEIGNALLRMKDYLSAAAEKEKQRKKEEENNNYITTGIAKFSEILRINNYDIKVLSNTLLQELTEYVGAVQAGLFVVNDDKDKETTYTLTGAVAYKRLKNLKLSFKVSEGLVGRCAYEKELIYMTEVPDNYVNITSGLCTANPRSILLIPAITNNKVYAVIELASFRKFKKHEISLIEQIGEHIAATFANVKSNQHTMKLLEESKKYSEEMAAQEEELRQNIEELQATQEEMKRKEEQLKELSEKLEKQQEMLKVKMSNLDE